MQLKKKMGEGEQSRGAVRGALALIFIYLYWRMRGMFQCNLSKYAGYIPDLLSASAASIDFHLSHPGSAEFE